MKQILILVEGETERKLIKALNIAGRVRIVNLWENPINKILPTINKQLVYIIFDTDTLKQISFFQNNLRVLEKNNIDFKLFQQTNNLEDELVRCTNCKTINDIFNTQGVKEFKNQWNKSNNLEQKLLKLNFRTEQLWSGQLSTPLKAWNHKKASFKDIKK